MYVGRFLTVGPGIGAYRVSSRSFPNRQVVDRDGTLTVVPTPDAPETDNPYISYNCVRRVTVRTDLPASVDSDDTVPGAVVGNGSHVDPVTEKIDLGVPPRDALATALLAMDFEKDDYDTPRIAGVVTPEIAHVGIVRRDALVVEAVDEPTLVATYEAASPRPFELQAETANDVATEVYDHEFEHAVCAAGVTVDEAGVTTAIDNG